MGLIDAVPSFYAETYDPSRVLLTEVYVAQPGDLGMHLLVAPPGESPRHGLTDAVFVAIMRWCFDRLGATRVVAEPDVNNYRIRAKNMRAGFRELEEVTLEEGDLLKTAVLSVCTRTGFTTSTLFGQERGGRA
jgi:hypothetical protein